MVYESFERKIHFPRYWHFVQGIQLSPVNSPDKDQCRRALIFSLICALNKTLDDLSTGFHVWKANPSAKLSLIAISVDFLTYEDEVRFTGELPIFAPSPLNEFTGTRHISMWPPVHMSGVTQTTLVLFGSCPKLTSGSGSINPMIAVKYKLWK